MRLGHKHTFTEKQTKNQLSNPMSNEFLLEGCDVVQFTTFNAHVQYECWFESLLLGSQSNSLLMVLGKLWNRIPKWLEFTNSRELPGQKYRILSSTSPSPGCYGVSVSPSFSVTLPFWKKKKSFFILFFCCCCLNASKSPTEWTFLITYLLSRAAPPNLTRNLLSRTP